MCASLPTGGCRGGCIKQKSLPSISQACTPLPREGTLCEICNHGYYFPYAAAAVPFSFKRL
jgi:hypothetical protein